MKNEKHFELNAEGLALELIDEISHYIDSELGKIQFERRKISPDTKDFQLTHKRATLAGNCIALSRMKQFLKKKKMKIKK